MQQTILRLLQRNRLPVSLHTKQLGTISTMAAVNKQTRIFSNNNSARRTKGIDFDSVLRTRALTWALILKAHGIELVGWDWDGTIVRTYGLAGGIPYKNDVELETKYKEWSSQVARDFPFMYYALKYAGIHQCIVTHNQDIPPTLKISKGERMIRGILTHALDAKEAGTIRISAFLARDKLYHLDNNARWFGTKKPGNILLVDDNQYNIDTAWKAGYSTWLVKNPTIKGYEMEYIDGG
jgi:hypothetical protein